MMDNDANDNALTMDDSPSDSDVPTFDSDQEIQMFNSGTGRGVLSLFSNESVLKAGFLFLGIGFLLPWNAFISASAYFQSRTCIDYERIPSSDVYHDTNGGKENPTPQNNFMLWFGLLYNLSGVVTLGLMILRQKQLDRSSMAHRHNAPSQNETQNGDETTSSHSHSRVTQWRMVVISLCLFLIAMMLTTSLVLIPSVDPELFKMISLSSAGICGSAGAFTSAGIVSFAAIFPPDLGIQPFISGQAIGGVVISALNFVLFGMETNGKIMFWKQHCSSGDTTETELYNLEGWEEQLQLQALIQESSPTCESYDVDWGAFSYFLVGCFFIISCMGIYIYLDRSAVAAYYRGRERNIEERIDSNGDIIQGNDNNAEMSVPIIPNTEADGLTEPLLESDLNHEEGMHLNLPLVNQDHCSDACESKTALVWKLVGSTAVCIFMTFFITLTIFPSWATKLESVHQCENDRNRLSNDLFIPGILVLFNCCDFAGRAMTGYLKMSTDGDGPSKYLPLASYARLIFFPMFLLCKVEGGTFLPSLQIFHHDFFPILFIAAFAFTNGFVSTLGFIQAAISTPATEEIQQIASTILNFSVGLGLLCGSLFSFVYNLIGTTRW